MSMHAEEVGLVQLDRATRKVVWVMVCIMALSFLFGIGMFVPSEHRADKLDEMMRRYQARKPGTEQQAPVPKKRIVLPE